MAVGPVDADGVVADRLHAAGLHGFGNLLVADHALAAPFLDALGARAARSKPSGGELRFLAVVPAHQQRPRVVEGEVARPHDRLLWLDLVEESHVRPYIA